MRECDYLSYFCKKLDNKDSIDIEETAKFYYNSVRQLHIKDQELLNHYSSVLNTLQNGYIINDDQRILIREKSCMLTIVLVSLKHFSALFRDANSEQGFFENIISCINKTFSPTSRETVNLLKLLILIIMKKNTLLRNSALAQETFNMAQKAAFSSYKFFKPFANTLLQEIVKNSNINLPLEDLLRYPNLCTKESLTNEVICYTVAHLTCSEGVGAAVKTYSKYIEDLPFKEWCKLIFPIIEERLFSEKSLKYWLPSTVKVYKNNLYDFIKSLDVDFLISAYILLETKRQDFFKEEYYKDVLIYINNQYTEIVGLQIIATFIKKSQNVTNQHLDAVQTFLLNYSETETNEKALKSLKFFLTQIFITPPTNESESFMEFLYFYILNRLDTPFGYDFYKVVLETVNDSFSTLYNFECKELKTPNFSERLEKSDFLNRTFNNRLFLEKLKKSASAEKSVYFSENEHANHCTEALKALRLDSCSFLMICENFIENLARNFEKKESIVDDIKRCLDFVEIQLNESECISWESYKIEKFRLLLSVLLEILLKTPYLWEKFDNYNLMRQLCVIIEKSNLKRSVSMAVKILENISLHLDTNDSKKIKLLTRVLNDLHTKPNQLKLKIRRSPEVRLVIHALCLTKTSEKPLLHWVIPYLLDICTESLNTHIPIQTHNTSTLASTIDCLEKIILDNSLHDETLKYIPSAVKICMGMYNINDMKTENSNAQLLRALTTRCFGQETSYGVCTRTIQDFFNSFPEFIEIFKETLLSRPYKYSSIVPINFFAVSRCRGDSFRVEIKEFRKIFKDLIQQDVRGKQLLITAYCSTITEREIPSELSFEVETFIENFNKFNSGSFNNHIYLLSEFCVICPHHPEIENKIENLINFLRHQKHKYSNLLVINWYNYKETFSIMNSFNYNKLNFKQRIFLNDQLKLFSVDSFIDDFIPKILLNRLPDYLLFFLLNIIKGTPKFYENFNIAHQALFSQIMYGEDKVFMLEVYSHAILQICPLVFESQMNADFLKAIRGNYHTDNIYKIVILIKLLNSINKKNSIDTAFIEKAVGLFVKHSNIMGNESDYNKIQILSMGLIYLFNVSSKKNYPPIIKLAFLYLFNEKTSWHICNFTSKITKRPHGTVLFCLKNLLDVNTLLNLIDDARQTLILLLELYNFVKNLPKDNTELANYFLLQSDYYTPKEWILKFLNITIKSVVPLVPYL